MVSIASSPRASGTVPVRARSSVRAVSGDARISPPPPRAAAAASLGLASGRCELLGCARAAPARRTASARTRVPVGARGAQHRRPGGARSRRLLPRPRLRTVAWSSWSPPAAWPDHACHDRWRHRLDRVIQCRVSACGAEAPAVFSRLEKRLTVLVFGFTLRSAVALIVGVAASSGAHCSGARAPHRPRDRHVSGRPVVGRHHGDDRGLRRRGARYGPRANRRRGTDAHGIGLIPLITSVVVAMLVAQRPP